MHYELNNARGPYYALKLKIARKLVFSKWQEALGGKLKVIVSGGAALQPRLAHIFWAAGIPVSYTHLDVYKRQVYGLLPAYLALPHFGIRKLFHFGGRKSRQVRIQPVEVCLCRLQAHLLLEDNMHQRNKTFGPLPVGRSAI